MFLRKVFKVGSSRNDWQLKSVISDPVRRWLPQLYALGLHTAFKGEKVGGGAKEKHLFCSTGRKHFPDFLLCPYGNWITWASLTARQAEKYLEKGFKIPMIGLGQSQFMGIQPSESRLFCAFFLSFTLTVWPRPKKEE